VGGIGAAVVEFAATVVEAVETTIEGLVGFSVTGNGVVMLDVSVVSSLTVVLVLLCCCRDIHVKHIKSRNKAFILEFIVLLVVFNLLKNNLNLRRNQNNKKWRTIT